MEGIIKVYCGISVEKNIQKTQKHPLTEVISAKKIIDLNSPVKVYSNDADFISTMKHYGDHKGVNVEFFLNDVSCGDDIEPIFEDLNRGLSLINKICNNGSENKI